MTDGAVPDTEVTLKVAAVLARSLYPTVTRFSLHFSLLTSPGNLLVHIVSFLFSPTMIKVVKLAASVNTNTGIDAFNEVHGWVNSTGIVWKIQNILLAHKLAQNENLI